MYFVKDIFTNSIQFIEDSKGHLIQKKRNVLSSFEWTQDSV